MTIKELESYIIQHEVEIEDFQQERLRSKNVEMKNKITKEIVKLKFAKEKLEAQLKDLKKKAVDESIKALKDIKRGVQNASKNPSNLNKIVKIATTIALLSVLSMWFYRKYFTPALRACRGKKGEEHSKCINDYKKQALEKTISILKTKLSQCDKTDKPEQCKENVEKLIKKFEEKLKGL